MSYDIVRKNLSILFDADLSDPHHVPNFIYQGAAFYITSFTDR